MALEVSNNFHFLFRSHFVLTAETLAQIDPCRSVPVKVTALGNKIVIDVNLGRLSLCDVNGPSC